MSLYIRARRHIDMNRVKELREEKIKKKEIAELVQHQQEIRAELAEIEAEESKHVDWRRELEEGMTSSGMFLVSLPAAGDVDLENVSKSAEPGTSGSGGSGGSYSFGTYDETGNGGFSIVLDTRKFDTLKFSASRGGATRIELAINGGDFSTLSSGTNIITISAANRRSNSRFVFNAFKSDGSGSTGASISGTVFQRRLPVNAFVGLDDPDASAFVRDGDYDRLSPADKKKKLEEQLAASSEYLDKMFGEGMPGTATEIADIQPQQSFVDMAIVPSDYDPDDGTKIAAGGNPRGTGGKSAGDPANIQWPRDKYPDKKAPPGPGYRPPTAKKKPQTMVAHHEPQGKVLTEKKRLKSPKDLVDKIPGYYDGKPSPLGFPVEEPPKMKNGFHPDLVDGKKVSQRFNRLDPISAKAMPPTGNPHIDKKVRAAAKKPK